MRIGSKGLELIKSFEGYHTKLPNGSCQAYLDKLVKPAYRSPGYKGLWTIGYGCTDNVTEGLVWTEKQAEAALMREIAKHEAALNSKLSSMGLDIDQNQFDALISASYNLGSASTLIKNVLKYLKQGNEKLAGNQFAKYNRAGGKVYKGLVRRRAAERKLFDLYVHKDVVEASRSLTLMQRLRTFIAGLGLTAATLIEFMHDAKDFLVDNAGIIALTTGISLFLISKWLENSTVKAYEEGRYTPSGIEE